MDNNEERFRVNNGSKFFSQNNLFTFSLPYFFHFFAWQNNRLAFRLLQIDVNKVKFAKSHEEDPV